VLPRVSRTRVQKNFSAVEAIAPSSSNPRAPAPVLGIDVNHCKTPTCVNFGVTVAPTVQRGPGAVNAYTISATKAGVPAARCNACGEIFGLKSNLGIYEEAYRLLAQTYPAASCRDPFCRSHRVPTHVSNAYQAFGTTKLGSRRYRCKACGKTFSVKPKGLNPIARQKQSDKNRLILSMLIGKMPLRRICEAASVHPEVLYERIDFFHEQSLALLSDRERHLEGMEIPRLYVGVDRQDNVVNWTQRKDKRNVTLTSVAAADNGSGYVFGVHPNFDPEPDPVEVEKRHIALGDDQVGVPYRRFARLWLGSDYAASQRASQKLVSLGTLSANIATVYANAERRMDVESSENVTKDTKLPERGMLVHSEYTLYGFFIALRKLFCNVEKVRFFLDQDSGMRAACLAAFADRIKEHRCDVFYVSIAKDLTVDEKRQRLQDAKERFNSVAKEHPELTKEEVKRSMLLDRVAAAQAIGQWKDRWVFHPLPSMSEPEKALCHLTDLGQYDPDHLAWLYNKASLHAVDSFFNRIRRRSMMLERPFPSAANRHRVWNAYSPYRPEQINKIQTILRACHNYVWLPEGKKAAAKGTPAMRLGLAKAQLDLNDILYFRKS
jgi:transposase-like protein